MHASAEKNIRVGVFNYSPSVYISDNGKPEGFFIDLIEDIAGKERWKITYVPGSLQDVLKWLSDGSIDLGLDLTKTPEREGTYDFTTESALSSWAQIYAADPGSIQSLLDLEGKKISLVKGDVNGEALKDNAKKFNVHPEYEEFSSLDQAFQSVKKGSADALVTGRMSGQIYSDKYDLPKTSVMFNPNALGFAVPKGKNADLLVAIDNYLKSGKSNPSSFYSKTIQKWFGEKSNWEIPSYVYWIIFVIASLVVLSIFFNVWLEKEVRRKTSDLTQRNQELHAAYEHLSAVEEKLRDNYAAMEQNEVQLRENESMLRSMFEATPVGVGLIKERVFYKVNHALTKITGYSENELIGQITRIIYPDEKEFNRVGRDLYTQMNTDGIGVIEANILRKDGVVINALVSHVLFDKNDPNGGVTTSILDITERKRSEIELKKYRDNLEDLVKRRTIELEFAKNQAETANRAKSDFLSLMSHELRTPLNAILGYASILLNGKNLTKEQKNQLKIIHSSGQHLLTVINDLLDLGRIEAKKLDLLVAPFNPAYAILQIVRMNRVKAEEKNLLLLYEPPINLPQLVDGDERKFKQIILNLISNAIKYTNEGKVTIRVHYNEKSSCLSFIVEDTGIGIESDKQDLIFEPFTHITSPSRYIEGTGLGLSITKHLVELMQGQIGVRSKPGLGSCFFVRIKLPPSLEEISRVLSGLEITGYWGGQKKILLAIDDIFTCGWLRSIFEPIGFSLSIANSKSSIIDTSLLEHPDLILLDFELPETDSIELTRELRNYPELTKLKIIGIINNKLKEDNKKDLMSVCDEFVTKPIQTEVVIETIKNHLGIEWKTESIYEDKEKIDNEELQVILPPPETLKSIIESVKSGDYDELEELISGLRNKDKTYEPFCRQIEQYALTYNDDGIIIYIQKMMERKDGRK